MMAAPMLRKQIDAAQAWFGIQSARRRIRGVAWAKSSTKSYVQPPAEKVGVIFV